MVELHRVEVPVNCECCTRTIRQVFLCECGRAVCDMCVTSEGDCHICTYGGPEEEDIEDWNYPAIPDTAQYYDQ